MNNKPLPERKKCTCGVHGCGSIIESCALPVKKCICEKERDYIKGKFPNLDFNCPIHGAPPVSSGEDLRVTSMSSTKLEPSSGVTWEDLRDIVYSKLDNSKDLLEIMTAFGDYNKKSIVKAKHTQLLHIRERLQTEARKKIPHDDLVSKDQNVGYDRGYNNGLNKAIELLED